MAAIAFAAVVFAFSLLAASGESRDGIAATATDTAGGGSGPIDTLKDQFVLALREWDKERFLSLVVENPDVSDLVFEDGNSLLGYAAMIGSLEVLRILLDRGADPDLGSTRPLEHALISFGVASSNRVEFAETIADLLDAGATYDFNTFGGSGDNFVSALGYIICESEKYDALSLKPFARLDIEFVVNDEVIRHYQYLKEVRDVLGPDGLLDPKCFDYFWARLVNKR
jgi:hypothetical protein